MNSAAKPLLVAAAVIALGAGVGIWTRSSPTAARPRAEPVANITPTAEESLVNDSAQGMESQPAATVLPWQNAAGRNTEPVLPPSTALPTPAASLPAPLADPVQLQAQLGRNGRTLEQALAQLNELESTGKLPPELDARAVRTNLDIAKRAQQLASEMIALTQQPATEARQNRIEEIVTELRAMQNKVKVDVMRPANGGAR